LTSSKVFITSFVFMKALSLHSVVGGAFASAGAENSAFPEPDFFFFVLGEDSMDYHISISNSCLVKSSLPFYHKAPYSFCMAAMSTDCT